MTEPTTANPRESLIQQKLGQLPAILAEKAIQAWLLFVRESEVLHDPTLDTLVGANVTWQSAFLFDDTGRRIAIVGSLDVARIERTGHFTEVVGYGEGIGHDLRRVLADWDPKSLALNFSTETELADGLTHGMYLLLERYLEGTPFLGRTVSSQPIVAALRGRKSAFEVEQIRQACTITQEIFDAVTPKLRVGLTELDVAQMLRAEMDARGLQPAWEPTHCPAVFTGPDSAGAHADPTATPIEPGHVMNVDMGVKVGGYCSDMQRTWYFLRPGETSAPAAVVEGFQTIAKAIEMAGEALKPGALGHEIDGVARGYITGKGYPGYDHGLGHQVGQTAHDGIGLLCPKWERYGERAILPIEAGQVYTIEPRLPIEGHGIATMEEIVVVTEDGCRYLSEPQKELYLVAAEEG